MTTSEIEPGQQVENVEITDEYLTVHLLDGRRISVPLEWYPRLANATPQQRANWEIMGGGFGIHWPDVDEDLSTQGILRGIPAPRRSTTPN